MRPFFLITAFIAGLLFPAHCYASGHLPDLSFLILPAIIALFTVLLNIVTLVVAAVSKSAITWLAWASVVLNIAWQILGVILIVSILGFSGDKSFVCNIALVIFVFGGICTYADIRIIKRGKRRRAMLEN